MMAPSQLPIDAEVRELAARPTGNWVLRAPAGSGKTTLLVTRFLELLSRVEKPEEVLAITFTRKATAEMRERILESLKNPASARPIGLVEAAERARHRGLSKGWEFIANPSRLKIQTIESFRRSLVEASPVEAGIAPKTQLVEDARHLYGEAVDRAFRLVMRGEASASCVAQLLRLENNDPARVRRQLVDMLGKRDQWRGKLFSSDSSAEGSAFERQRWLQAHMHGLWSLVKGRIRPHELARLVSLDDFLPEQAVLTNPATWRRLARLLLTKHGTFREQAPAMNPDQKVVWNAIRVPDCPISEHMLRAAKLLPDPIPTAREQARLVILKDSLGLVLEELHALFDECNTIDLVELGFGASRSLGDDELPTDLIIALDYSIKHILVDEFQDTSVTQSEFLHSLIREWTPGDDRSFFAVGDPMQSIYGFREAEVGLFSLAEAQGVGRPINHTQRAVGLQSACLKTNFRSQPHLVDWVNQVFPSAFGESGGSAQGSVRFEPAVALAEAPQRAPQLGVQFHLFQKGEGSSEDDHDEARFIARHADALLAEFPQDSLAVLLRSRSHTPTLLEALRSRKLAHQGYELDPLHDEPVVQDMLSLAKSIASATNRLANYSLLRSPAAGLSLASLHRLSQGPLGQISTGKLMQDQNFVQWLSGAEASALQRLTPLLSDFRAEYGRSPPRSLLERAWIKSGLAAAYIDERSRSSVQALLSLIEQQGRAWIDFQALDAALEGLYAPAVSEARLRLMTIHQAKGLEFDHVILPFTAKGTKSEQGPPLRWYQYDAEFLLATRHGRKEEGSAYEWLDHQHKARVLNEAKRVLYVAVTRAKKSLCLTGSLAHSSMEPAPHGLTLTEKSKPRADALIAPVWKLLATSAKLHSATEHPAKPLGNRRNKRPLRRLPQDFDWRPKKELPSINLTNALTLPEETANDRAPAPTSAMNSLDAWSPSLSTIVGTVVHEGLRWLSLEPCEADAEARVHRMGPLIRRWLLREWLEGQTLESALRQANRHLLRALKHKDCQWILGPRQSAESERDFSAFLDNRLVNIRVDRTFIEAGKRFIIDYKTSSPRARESRLDFRKRQAEEHRPQLQAYARVFRELEDRPVEAALFLTSTPELVRVAIDEDP